MTNSTLAEISFFIAFIGSLGLTVAHQRKSVAGVWVFGALTGSGFGFAFIFVGKVQGWI